MMENALFVIATYMSLIVLVELVTWKFCYFTDILQIWQCFENCNLFEEP